MKTLTILSTIFILSSCAFHSGTITSNVTNEPVVHKDIAVGAASTNIVLGFGGLSKDALISQARKNMILYRPLEGAEQYNNVEVNIKNTYYIFGRKTKVTINADVIQAKDSVNQATYSEEYLELIKSKELEQIMFSIGDSVIINNFNLDLGRITGFVENNSNNLVEVTITDSDGKRKTKIVKPKNIFISKPEHMGLKLGDRFKDGIIIGFGKNHVLIRVMYGNTTYRYPR